MFDGRRVLIAALLVLLLGAGAICRFMQLIPYPVGGGRDFESPDKQYTASAMDMHSEDFWGRTSSWYEFEVIEAKSDKVVARREMPIPRGSVPVYWREEGLVAWSADSREVEFSDGKRVVWSARVR